MKSITIHGLDDTLDGLIREQSVRLDLSLNKTIKKLLRESLGVAKASRERTSGHFDNFFGLWSEKEARRIKANLADFAKIDKEDWQ